MGFETKERPNYPSEGPIGTTLAFCSLSAAGEVVRSACRTIGLGFERKPGGENLGSGTWILQPVFPTTWSGVCRYPSFACWAESCTGTWDRPEGKSQLYRDGNQSTVTRVFSLISPEQRGHCATRDIRYSVKRGSLPVNASST